MQLSPHIIANDVRLRRQLFNGAFLLVEGSTDSLFLKRVIDSTSCMVVPTLGRENTIGALEILNDDEFPGVLAIVDADFDRLENTLSDLRGLLFFDHHDMEVMLLVSPALDDLLREFGSEDKILRLQEDAKLDVREILLMRAQEVGLLRWLSHREGLSMRFEGLSFGSFVNPRSIAIDIDQMITTVKNHSRLHGLDNRTVQESLAVLRARGMDQKQVCCGHDIIEILSLGLRRVLGSVSQSDAHVMNLERSLRLAYEDRYFRSTELYAAIVRWQEENPPFVVVR